MGTRTQGLNNGELRGKRPSAGVMTLQLEEICEVGCILMDDNVRHLKSIRRQEVFFENGSTTVPIGWPELA
jgi:hypothetical protein